MLRRRRHAVRRPVLAAAVVGAAAGSAASRSNKHATTEVHQLDTFCDCLFWAVYEDQTNKLVADRIKHLHSLCALLPPASKPGIYYTLMRDSITIPAGIEAIRLYVDLHAVCCIIDTEQPIQFKITCLCEPNFSVKTRFSRNVKDYG